MPVDDTAVRSEHWVLAPSLAAAICINVGFRGEALVTALAVAKAESDLDAWVQNNSANDYKWGPAVGLFQVRTLRNPSAASGLDRQRVLADMKYPARNAKFAYELSKGGKNWKPWTAYTNGSYRKFIEQAREWALNPDEEKANTKGAPSVPLTDNDWIDEDRRPLPIVLGGDAHPGDLGNRIVSATLDYSMAQASLATFELEDQDASLLRSAKLSEGTPLRVAKQRHIVTSVGAKQGPGSPHITMEAQPAGIVRLRGVTPAKVTGMSAVQFARRLAKTAGMPFAGGPASPKISITPEEVQVAGSQTAADLDPTLGLIHGTRKENAWEVLLRLAEESTGYICFESGGTLYFATQQWLYQHAGVVYVQVGNASFADARRGTAIRAIGFPDIRRAIKRDSRNLAYRHAEVTVDLPPGPGYAALPGKRMWMAEPTGIIDDSRPLLIQRSRVMDGDSTAFVRVDAASYSAPGDTESQPSTVHDKGAGSRGSGTSQNGWPASSNPAAIGIGNWKVPGSPVSLRVANIASKLLIYVASEFDANVEPLIPGICGGYNYRTIAGTSTISNHGSGTAIDLNWTHHAQGKRGTFSAGQVREIRRILADCKGCIRWGGDYNGSYVDEMHFEVIADPSVVKSRFG